MSRRVRPTLSTLSLVSVAALSLLAAAPAPARQDDPTQPVFHDFKGVSIGMSAQESRQKLGSPSDKSDALDLYEVSDKQTVQVFYDAGKVSAIAVVFMKPGADVPAPKAVVGTDIEARADGSLYKMVRYPKAGYWVSYSRTAGDAPIVSITMQKIN